MVFYKILNRWDLVSNYKAKKEKGMILETKAWGQIQWSIKFRILPLRFSG